MHKCTGVNNERKKKKSIKNSTIPIFARSECVFAMTSITFCEHEFRSILMNKRRKCVTTNEKEREKKPNMEIEYACLLL